MWGEEGEGTLLSSAKGFKLYRSANIAQRKEEECGGWLLEGALVNEPIAAEDIAWLFYPPPPGMIDNAYFTAGVSEQVMDHRVLEARSGVDQ